MNRKLVVPLLVLLAVVAALTSPPSPAPAANARLSSPVTYTAGDDVAERMAAIFRVTAGLEPAALVYYDRKARNLVAEILGSTDDVEGAKREIEAFVLAIRDRVAPYALKQHGIRLSDKDVTLIYHNDTGDEPPYEVVRRENGTFVVPAPEPGE
jgi:hypothetical protein